MAPRRLAILTVCTANICRSPVMEMLFRAALDKDRFEVGSAGVRGWHAHQMDSMAAAELARLGHSPEPFSSRPIDSHLVDSADLILTATRSHRAEILSLNPLALRRTFTLVEFAALINSVDAPDPMSIIAEAARQRSLSPAEVDIKDPYRRGPEAHRDAANQISVAVTAISNRLNDLAAAHAADVRN